MAGYSKPESPLWQRVPMIITLSIGLLTASAGFVGGIASREIGNARRDWIDADHGRRIGAIEQQLKMMDEIRLSVARIESAIQERERIHTRSESSDTGVNR